MWWFNVRRIRKNIILFFSNSNKSTSRHPFSIEIVIPDVWPNNYYNLYINIYQRNSASNVFK